MTVCGPVSRLLGLFASRTPQPLAIDLGATIRIGSSDRVVDLLHEGPVPERRRRTRVFIVVTIQLGQHVAHTCRSEGDFVVGAFIIFGLGHLTEFPLHIVEENNLDVEAFDGGLTGGERVRLGLSDTG